jgi:methylated-DNA-[protein]-cysteine S-methyltransferase
LASDVVTLVRYEAEGWGVGELWFSEGRLIDHRLPRPGPPRTTTRSDRNREIDTSSRRLRSDSATSSSRLGGALADRIRAYFERAQEIFDDVELDLDWCTPFQRAVADALRAVPYGEVVTYGELAALAGYPNAQRAAGTFCAHNRFALIVPCHRVVAATGLGSYGELGPDFKRRLLELEGVAL